MTRRDILLGAAILRRHSATVNERYLVCRGVASQRTHFREKCTCVNVSGMCES